MKKIITIFLLLPLGAFAQIPDSVQVVLANYTVSERTVTYSKVYDVPGKSAAEIKNILVSSFSGVPRVTLNQNTISDNQVVGTLTDHMINFRKYGGKWGTTSIWVQYPISGKFTFQIKDNKYRVVVTDIISTASPALIYSFNADFATKENTLRGVSSKTGYLGYYYFAKSVDELFTAQKPLQDNW